MNIRTNSRKQGGFSILEVVIGIFIFTVGMLALGALQGALTRSMSDAKLRTTAANIADSFIERQRGFTRILTAATPGVPFAYNDIVTPGVGAEPTVTLNGVVYTINMTVSDFYYQLKFDTFTSVNTLGAANSDYKQVDVTVTWNADQRFRADEGTEITAANLRSGGVTLTSVIPALITSASARIAEETTNGAPTPPISYQPGQRPDVVSLSLGDNKFKESLLPEPDVIRLDRFVETRFDVITYSGTGTNATFLRREEFAAVSCECTLKAADSSNQGLRPVVWAGDEYKGGHKVTKRYGVPAQGAQQSEICTSCCRDHHDGGTSSDDSSDTYYNAYGPFKSGLEYTGGLLGARTSNHKHYKIDGVTVAGVNDKYLEACRAVRVDGFFRTAQDFRREDQNVFPGDFLDEEAEVDVYSDYATSAVAAYYGDVSNGYPSRSTPPCIGGPSPCVAEPTMQGDSPSALGADEFPSWTSLPLASQPTQQLRSRGIYIDYMSNDLRTVFSCINGGGDASTCQSGDVKLDKTGSSNILELIPFFDVQLTKLNRWSKTPFNSPVNVTNQPLADNGNYSRGVISKSADGSSDVRAVSHRGNIGFTDTQAIDPEYNSYVTTAKINVQAGSGGPADPPPSGDPVVGGNLTSNVTGQPLATSDLTIVGSGNATCQNTGANWSCEVPAGSTSATVTVSNYYQNNKNRYVCLNGSAGTMYGGTGGASTSTAFSLQLLVPGTTYTISVKATAC